MKFAYIKENIVVSIVLADSINELLPLDTKFSNIVELTDFLPEPQVGWSFINNVFIDPQTNQMAQASVNKKITKLALLNRFTNTELALYEQAIAVSIPLKILDKKLFATTYVDLNRQDTIQGILALVSANIISQQRADEILNTLPNSTELYRE